MQVAFSYDISARADLENITLTGTGAINATGNSNANVLTGNSGVNILTGGAGDDTPHRRSRGGYDDRRYGQ